MTVSDGDIIRAAVVWEYNLADEQVNVFHLAAEVGAGTIDDVDFADAIEDYFTELYYATGVVNFMASELTHNRIELYNLTDDSPLLDVGAVPDLNGGTSTEVLPIAAAMLVLGRTAVKRRVGRKFLPVFTEAALNDGAWSSTAMAAGNAFGATWAATYIYDPNLQLGAVVGSTSPLSMSRVTQGIAQNLPAYQRRRKQGRGS